MSEMKLLPCPFCGGETELYTTNNPFRIGCRCSNCFGRTPSYEPNLANRSALDDIEKCKILAIKAWNTRKPIQEIVERLENNSFWTESTYDMDGYCNDDSEEVVHLDKAIQIVKEVGGV